MIGTFIAAIDIGKTNKRVVVFDDELNLVDEARESIDEIEGPNGLRLENIDAIEKFTDGALADLARRYPICAVGISTHAGTWVGIDGSGRRSLPVIAYTNDRAEAESDGLIAGMGGEDVLYEETATPRLPAFVNMGLGVAFAARHLPRQFSNTALILNFPQYLGYRLTGEAAVERTYLGCHTYLWNVAHDSYSNLAQGVGYKDRAPGRPQPTRGLIRPIVEPCARRLGLKGGVMVHLGVHDSNAALATAMGEEADRTLMLSTGTWCVAMAPGNGRLTQADRDKGILLNIGVDGRPVRTSIYKAGALYAELRASVAHVAQQHADTGLEGEVNTTDPPRVRLPPVPDAELVAVEMAPGTQMPWEQALQKTAVTAGFEEMWFDALGKAFAAEAWRQMEDVGLVGRTRVVVEGGFCHNRPFMAALRKRAGDVAVEEAPDEQGSARGAAMLAVAI